MRSPHDRCWIFTPDTGATSDVADTDYLNYGFWLMRTTDADGVLTYDEVQTFAGSSIDASASVTDVEGMASYEGGAVGVYVKNVIARRVRSTRPPPATSRRTRA